MFGLGRVHTLQTYVENWLPRDARLLVESVMYCGVPRLVFAFSRILRGRWEEGRHENQYQVAIFPFSFVYFSSVPISSV
jgi:hypothetical protein